ncbi:MAG: conjugal transfer protein TraG N-terminal domain-containing protein [Pseudoruegeria sp.]
MDLEIYTTGGAGYLTTTFNAIAAFCNTDDFMALLHVGVLLGLIVVLLQVLLGASIMDFVKTYVVVTIVAGLSIVPKANVIIYDKTQGSLPVAVVGNVPLSVAYVGHVTSSISEALTRQMETLFSEPTSLSYQSSGMLFGATLRAKSARWKAVTSSVHENAVNFLDQCVIDAVSLRYVEPGTVTNSGDLASTISTQLPNSLAYYDIITKSTRLCKDGWSDIETAIINDVDLVLGRQAAALYQVENSPGNGVAAINRLKEQISDFAAFSGVASTDAIENVKQSMLIAALDDAALRGISATGNAAALQHLQSARAEAQTRSSYQAVGNQALSWVPYLKIVFENLYYGAFPLALLLMMTPLAGQVARGYFGGFVWLASWEPLSAILHSIVLNTSANQYRQVTTTGTDGVSDGAVVSWANHFGVYAVEQDVAALAGNMMMSIPFIATVLFFGSKGMVGLATSSLAVSQSAATETGREMATGNHSYGNANVGNKTFDNFSKGNYNRDNYMANNRSWNNTSANRNVTSPYSDVGRSTYHGANGAQITSNRDGTISVMGGSNMSNTATSISLGNSIVSSLNNRASTAMEKSSQQRVAAENSLSLMSGQTSSYMQAISNGESFSKQDGTQQTQDEKTSNIESMRTVDQFAQARNISRSTALSLGLSATAGTPKWALFSAQAKSELNRSGITADNFNEVVEAARSENVDKAASKLQGSFNNLSETAQSSLTRTGDRGSRSSVEELQRHSKSAEASARQSEGYTAEASRVASDFVEGRVSLDHDFINDLSKRGYSPQQISNLTSGRAEHMGEYNQLRDAYSQNYIDGLASPEPSGSLNSALPDRISAGAVSNPGFERQDLMNSQLPEHVENQNNVRAGMESVRFDGGSLDAAVSAQEMKMQDRQQGVQGVSPLSQKIHDRTGGLPKGGADHSNVQSIPMSNSERDRMIRTIYGEAAGEGEMGQMAVAHVIRNRIQDGDFPNSVSGVAVPRQFSALNDDGSGNSLAFTIHPHSEQYQRIGHIVDQVMTGNSVDPTGGATHYYSPEGMDALVNQGYQSNRRPTWLPETTNERGGTNVRIGGHIFSGKAS